VSELVTGDAVVLEMRLARPATRALALIIDLALEAAGFGLVLIPVALVIGDDASESLVGGLIIVCLVATFVGYSTAIETLTRGKSVGKYALGLRVVRDDGGPVQFRQAFVRALAGVFADFFLTSGTAGLLTSMLNRRGKRVGDLLAGTVVVRERGPRDVAPLPEAPPQLVGWATRAELSRVPDQLALAARSYLSRYHDLAPAARDALGKQLAGAVAEYVSPPPPDGVPPWAYLAAVLGERRRRAFDRPDQAHRGWSTEVPQPQSTTPPQSAQQPHPPTQPRSAPQPEPPTWTHPHGSGGDAGTTDSDRADNNFAPPV
jgi:uncharacterized RDD family membrane protein YckC